jgi:yeast amino acid transporter
MLTVTEEKHDAKDATQSVDIGDSIESGHVSSVGAGSTQLHRRLKASQVQLYAIGAAIGTGVFVSMGSYLPNVSAKGTAHM